ncbi:MAG: hypothetical protein O7D94_11240, partial [Planctomycetota bacterium]|nr:hypothetical protein [Planctomycetota bacterium]
AVFRGDLATLAVRVAIAASTRQGLKIPRIIYHQAHILAALGVSAVKPAVLIIANTKVLNDTNAGFKAACPDISFLRARILVALGVIALILATIL